MEENREIGLRSAIVDLPVERERGLIIVGHVGAGKASITEVILSQIKEKHPDLDVSVMSIDEIEKMKAGRPLQDVDDLKLTYKAPTIPIHAYEPVYICDHKGEYHKSSRALRREAERKAKKNKR